MSDTESQMNKQDDSSVRSLGDAVIHGVSGNKNISTNARSRSTPDISLSSLKEPRTVDIERSQRATSSSNNGSFETMNDSIKEDNLNEGYSNETKSNRSLENVNKSNRAANNVASFKVMRVAFKVVNQGYSFKGYDELNLNNDGLALFEDEVFKGSKFYDLCRKKGKYTRYHSDFIQTYCFSLFNNTPFPSSVFVFVEEIEINNGEFSKEPCDITIRPTKQSGGISSIFDLPSFRHRNVETTSPEYELFYIESNRLTVENGSGSQNETFINVVSRYLRGSPKLRGMNFNKPGGFNLYADGVGMEFIKFTPYQGLVPNLKSSSTLVPLILLISRAIGYKYSLRRINKVLGNTLSQKLSKSNKLRRRARKNLKDLNFVYCGVELFLTQSFLVSSISYQNSTAQDIFREILSRLNIAQDYGRIKEQIEPLNHLLHQLSIAEMIRGQTSIRFSIIALGFFMVVIVVVVSAILGVEPMVRLLNDLGLLPPNLLKIN